jgi:hypothetical protein
MTEPPVGKSADKVAQSRQAPESPGIQAFGAIALAFLLYALLADAAIETFASGSSVRWWVAGIIVVYAAASVVLWRRVPRLWDRLGWRNRAAASFFLLLGLLAFTAWLPGGQVAGVKLAAQPTSTVFTAVTAVAVLLSTLVLLRALKSTPLWARAAVGALAAYGLGAFVIGIARHTPYSELLRGASLWVRAPFWLQGAFLGVFVVVPVAVVAEMITLGRRMAVRDAWSGEMGRLVALALSALMAAPALTLPRSVPGVALAGGAARFAAADAGQLEQAAAERLVNEPPAMPQADPAQIVQTAGAVVRGFRSEEWEVAALAASLGNDPAAAFAFVRDAIGFDPYAGVLRGAEGTLAARAGNAWDRALLLRALLARSGFKTRLAFATLDGETATRLIGRAYQKPVRSLSGAAPAGLLAHVVTAVAARARRDDAALRLALGSRLNELGVEDMELLRQEVAQHAWVQVLKGDVWVDLDPTLADAQTGKALAVASGTAEDVPPEQQHTIVVRVIAETLADEKLSETVSLERELTAATAADQYLLLGFLPEGKGGGLLTGGGTPSSFVSTLCVGDEAQTGQTIATTAAGGGAGFGSLFGGEESSGGDLVGLYIEIETRVPGRRPTVGRHVLLDRVPQDARSASAIRADALKPLAPDGGVPRALRGFHHLMISTGGTSPLDMARLRLSALDASLGSGGPASQQAPPSSPASLLWASDLTLVEGSEMLVVRALDSTERGRAYVDAPRVFLGSWFPEPTGADELSRETDLLIDSVRVLLPEPMSVREMAERQLQYGALQSALETETGLRLAAAWDPADRTIVSTSLAMGSQLTVLAPSDVQRLPAGSAGALKSALRGGDLAVVPGDVATATAWWTVARSGFARAIIEPGAGGFRVGPVGGASGAGGRRPGQQGGRGRGGAANEYGTLVNKVGQATKEVAGRGGQAVRDTFERAAPKALVKLQ